METQQSNHKLPSFADLQQSDETAFKADDFLQLVNRPCPAEWLKDHPMVKIKVRGQWQQLKYLPIDKVRWLLTRAFGAFVKEEILSVQQHFNSEVVTVRLHYCIPGTNVWLYQDGVGAVSVQTDKGEAAANLGAIKADGVMKAAPAAASFAVSNAAAKIGKVFGGDINKDDALEFTGTYSSQPAQPQITGPVHATQQPQPAPYGGAQTPAEAVKNFLQDNPPTQGPTMQPAQPQQPPMFSFQNAIL